ncbi:MAG: hypothetical protein QF645_02850 [Planctomycetota bacterium]|nr:hypothetical protein [Planctomycetota bacterium]
MSDIKPNVSVATQLNAYLGMKIDLNRSSSFRSLAGPSFEFSKAGIFTRAAHKVESIDMKVQREVKGEQEEIIHTLEQHITKHDKTVEKLTAEIGELKQRIQDYEAKVGVVNMEIDRSATISVAGPVTLRANTGEEAENRMHLQMQKYVELKNGPNFLRVDQQDIRVKRGFTAGVRNFVVEE